MITTATVSAARSPTSTTSWACRGGGHPPDRGAGHQRPPGRLVVGLSLIGLGAALDDPWSARLAPSGAIGPSTVIFGVALAATTRLDLLWRRRMRLVLLVVLVMLAVCSGALPDVLALAAGLVGPAVGATCRPPGPGPRWRASKSESRLLVALVVAASAAGP